VKTEDVVRAAFEVMKAAQVADGIDAEAVERCDATHRAKVASSDVEEAISRYLLRPGQYVPAAVPASNVWLVRKPSSAALHALILNWLLCEGRVDLRARDTARRAARAATALASARESLALLALRMTQSEELGGFDPSAARGPIQQVSGEEILATALEMKAAAESVDGIDFSGGRCAWDSTAHDTATNLQHDISDYLTAARDSRAPATSRLRTCGL
jgi:hypothetical protein